LKPSLSRWSELSQKISWYLWLLLLVTIPVTSSPLIARFSGGETPVSPLSIYPLLGLLLLWFVPYLLRGGKLPAISWPLLAFFLLALLSTAIAITLPVLPFKGQTPITRGTRALLTLTIGIGFYLTASTLPSTERKVILSIRALYFGLFLMLIWSTVQAWLVLDGSDRVPLVVTQIHHLFSVRDPFPDRVTGMSFEPSWLGGQLMVLYLPLLFASVVQKRSVFTSKRSFFTIELAFFLWTIFILLLTKSRISFLALLMVVGAAFLFAGLRFSERIQAYIGKRSRLDARHLRKLIPMLTLIVLLGSIVAVAFGFGWMMGQVDERMQNLLSIPERITEIHYFFPNEEVHEAANRLAFAERTVYWTTAFRTFGEHPILGVGPGNSGFYFVSNLPAYGRSLTEIENVLNLQQFGFPNPKNFWVRILAENGIVGFLCFTIWLGLIGIASGFLWRKGNGSSRILGLAGLLGIITFIVEGFSLDSYALPHSWVLFGLVTAGIGWGFQLSSKSAMQEPDEDQHRSCFS
jgi:O-antigen ligase